MRENEVVVYKFSPDVESLDIDSIPDGAYKYVIVGGAINFTPVLIGGSLTHRDISPAECEFNPEIDDAGFVRLRKMKSEEEMVAMVDKSVRMSKDMGLEFNREEYLQQLRNNFLKTHLIIKGKEGSSSLGLKPTPDRKEITRQFLQQLFGEEVVVEIEN